MIETYQYVLENVFTLLSTWKSLNNIRTTCHGGGVAQMVERSLSMREVPGSIPGASKTFFFIFTLLNSDQNSTKNITYFKFNFIYQWFCLPNIAK